MSEINVAMNGLREFGLRSRFALLRESMFRDTNGVIVLPSNRLALPWKNASPGLDFNIPRASGALTDHFARSRAATALVVHRLALRSVPAGYWLEAQPDAMVNDGFENLPAVPGAGTAFLVAQQYLVTAAHVVDKHSVAKSAFVFDFDISCLRQPEGDLPLRYEFARESVGFGESIFGPDATSTSDDITVVKLATAMTRPGLAIAKFDSLAKDQKVAMIGCARMQPMTLIAETETAPAPRVFSFDDRIVQTNIDSFQGHSGSALLDVDGDALGVHVGITIDDQTIANLGNDLEPTLIDNDVAVAAAVRMRVIASVLEEISAEIRT